MPTQTHPRWSFATELVLVLCFFCAPLFLGLRAWDLHNDESIYSYAVDRILETGEWLTPRSIPSDGPFLEKPPLKFWIVAGGIRSGLLPHNEIGLRFFDAVFGAVAFVYVFLFGRWIGGVGAGFVAVLVLFTIDSLLFEHGLRSNNMEAPLFLAYCGGLYHFARWAEHAGPPRVHAIACAAFFALGFMTKLVAVLFMALTAVLACLWRRDGWQRLRTGWRDWPVPALLVVIVVVPWFVYQTAVARMLVWREMFGVHVYERFTAALDAGHLEPWHYYFSWTWDELTFANSHWIAVAGIVTLSIKAWTGAWPPRLLLVWFAVSYALISMTTSKVSHYAYPFLPPIALGAGWAAVLAYRWADEWLARWVHTVSPRASFTLPSLPLPLPVRHVFFAVALALLGISLWTAVAGALRVELGPWELSNSSIGRPALMAVIPLALAGGRAIRRVIAMGGIALVLPIAAYPQQVEHTLSIRRPLQVVRECAKSVTPPSQRQTRAYVPYSRLRNHMFYYYPRQIGPWHESDRVDHDDLRRRLYEPGHQTLVVIAREDYDALGLATPGIGLSDDLLLLTPGPFAVCGRAALAAGGTEIGGAFGTRTRH